MKFLIAWREDVPIYCSRCGKELDESWEDNMSYNYEPLCEECYCEIEEEAINYNRLLLDEYIMEYESDKYGFYI